MAIKINRSSTARLIFDDTKSNLIDGGKASLQAVVEQIDARLDLIDNRSDRPIFAGITESEETEELPQPFRVESHRRVRCTLYGRYFDRTTTVSAVPTGQDLDTALSISSAFNPTSTSISFEINAQIKDGYLTTANLGIYDLVLTKLGFDPVIVPEAIEIRFIPYIDLRAGGEEFREGELINASSLKMSRDDRGMFFTGDTGWDTWAYFPKFEHSRSQPKTYEWIFTHANSLMIGIAGANFNPNTTRAYYEAEIMGFFNSSTSFYGFYGDSNNSRINQIINPQAIRKFVLEHNGEGGHKYWLYELPSADKSDWDDTSFLIRTGTIPDIFAQSDSLIAPYFIPESSTHRLIALKLI